MTIKAIYDNGGKTADRYTVYYNEVYSQFSGVTLWEGRGMSENPFHPCGVGNCIGGMIGKHNGKKIKFTDLPEPCRKLIKNDLKKTTTNH